VAAEQVLVYLTAHGSYTLVFCSECGPVSVEEGLDAKAIGSEHLDRTHGITEIEQPG
jgi:hypothetical protein